MAQSSSRAVNEIVIDLQRRTAEAKSRLDDVQGFPQGIGELRSLESIQTELDPIFRGLESSAPAPIRSESPRTYRRRLLGEIATELDSINRRRAAASGRGDLSPAEKRINEYARSSDWYSLSSNAIVNFGAEILDAARKLIDSPTQGSFRRPGELRVIETRSPGGHQQREFRGDPGTWIGKFCHPGQTCTRFGLPGQYVARPDVIGGGYDRTVRR